MAWAGYGGGQPAAAPYHTNPAAPYEDFSPQHYGYPLDWQYPSWQHQYPSSPPYYSNMPSSEPYGDFPTYHGHSASSYESSPQIHHVSVPESIRNGVRDIIEIARQIEGEYLVELGFPPNVDAAYDQVVAEGGRAKSNGRWYPEGAVIKCEANSTFATRYAWPLARRLPKYHPYNLESLAKAAKTLCDVRGLDHHNLTAPREDMAHLWGYDVDRLALPAIFPHLNPPAPFRRGAAAKREERELQALKWMFSLPEHQDYGYGHLFALRLHGGVFYDIVREISKAVPLRNTITNLTGCKDLQQALQMAERKGRAAERWM